MTRLVVLLAGIAGLFVLLSGTPSPERASVPREIAPQPRVPRWPASKVPLSPLPAERESLKWEIVPPRNDMKAYPSPPPVLHLAFRDNDTVLRSTHTNGEILEYNTETHQLTRRTRMEIGAGESLVAVSPDGRLWATATEAGVCRVWDTSHGTVRFQLAEKLHIPPLEASVVGRFRVPTVPLEAQKPNVNAVLVQFACNNQRLIARTGNGTRLAVCDVATGRTLHTIATEQPATCVTLSANGNTLFANVPDSPDEKTTYVMNQGIWAFDLTQDDENRVAVRLADAGAPPYSVGNSGTTVRSLHLLGDGDSLAVIATHRVLQDIGWPGREVPRDEHFAWLVHRGETVNTKLTPQSGADTFRLPHAHGIAISGDGRWLHSAGRLCDFATGQRRGHMMGWSMLSTFSADGEGIAFSYTGYGEVHLIARTQWRNVKVETD